MSTPGKILSSKYRLVREIGRGGMGSVWEAEQLDWRAPVAIKLMTTVGTHSEEALARFEREVRLAATLRSPHVVQVLDHGHDVEEGIPYLVMELLDGESLSRRIARLGALPVRETAMFLNHVGRALSRAHEVGIVHRDLKPDNVFLVRNEEDLIAKVLDFGVAKWDSPAGGSTLTRPGSVMGTPFYMSPEQVRGSGSLDHRSDLWSLGIIACECLTGRRPFEHTDFVELAMAICEGRNRPKPSDLGVVPAGFDEWFDKAAAINPDDRFRDAREQVQALQKICGVSSGSGAVIPEVRSELAGRTAYASSLRPMEGLATPQSKPAGRGKVAAWLAAVGLASATAGGIWYFANGDSPPPSTTIAAQPPEVVKPTALQQAGTIKAGGPRIRTLSADEAKAAPSSANGESSDQAPPNARQNVLSLEASTPPIAEAANSAGRKPAAAGDGADVDEDDSTGSNPLFVRRAHRNEKRAGSRSRRPTRSKATRRSRPKKARKRRTSRPASTEVEAPSPAKKKNDAYVNGRKIRTAL